MKAFILLSSGNIVKCIATKESNLHGSVEGDTTHNVEIQGSIGDGYNPQTGVWTDNQPVVVNYDPDTLISWALSQVFAEALIPHMAAFLDFANKATEVSKANFLAYATAVGLTTTANTIIAKAIELGADL